MAFSFENGILLVTYIVSLKFPGNSRNISGIKILREIVSPILNGTPWFLIFFWVCIAKKPDEKPDDFLGGPIFSLLTKYNFNFGTPRSSNQTNGSK